VGTSRILLAALILCSACAAAQTTEVHAKPLTENDIKLLRQDLQATKNDVITDTMQFTTSEAAAFWPVYREYSSEQHAIADKRLHLITEYAQNLDKMEDATANSLTERLFQIEDDTQVLRKKYFPKFKQALGAKRAAKFYQVDNRLTLMTNLQLAAEIPLIP
jgi:transketolase